MQLSCIVVALTGLITTSAAAGATLPRDAADMLAALNGQARDTLEQAESDATDATTKRDGTCNLFNSHIRTDWALLSPDSRKDYIRAVKCLMAKPSISPAGFAAGAKSRYDDFVALHMNQTLSIHGTGNFLSWHRYYLYSYETALRNECGYQGYQPYWNWFTYTNDLTKSPVFDGSDTSMSGDGAFNQHNGSLAGAGHIWLPSGNGGGCLKDGPFVNMTANLGPVSPTMQGEVSINGGKLSLAYNPRCLKRDLSSYTASTWLTIGNLLNLTIGPASASVYTFQNELQGRFTDGFLGLHAGGHFTIGGDAGDIFSSPVDPAFWLHHAMLDHVWWLWQALHLNQASTVAGTITLFNNPPSRNTTLDDALNMGVNAPTVAIRDVLNTLGGTPLCYIYL